MIVSCRVHVYSGWHIPVKTCGLLESLFFLIAVFAEDGPAFRRFERYFAYLAAIRTGSFMHFPWAVIPSGPSVRVELVVVSHCIVPRSENINIVTCCLFGLCRICDYADILIISAKSMSRK
jgi:hypothetical protein